MFCGNCGKEIAEDQKYCPHCGNKITRTAEPSKSSDLSVEKEGGSKKSNSIKCLVFGIIAASCAAVAFFGGGGILFRLIVNYYGNYQIILDTPSLLALLIGTITSIYIFHILGVIFGVLARSSSKKAKDTEMENGLRKAGNILALLGLIFNILGLVIITSSILFVLALFLQVISI